MKTGGSQRNIRDPYNFKSAPHAVQQENWKVHAKINLIISPIAS